MNASSTPMRPEHLSSRWLAGAVAALLIALPAADAWAGAFTVTPVRIYMTPRDRAVALTVINEGDAELVLQTDLTEWTQRPDGSDELKPTEDLIVAPPIIKLAPNARQVVRLALVRPADASRQLTFRLIVREVPEAVKAKDDALQVPISLVLSLPVFVTPPPAQRAVACEAARNDAKSLNIQCANTGSAYAQVREIAITRGAKPLANFEGGVYILPGARKTTTVRSEQALDAGPAVMEVRFDDGKSQSFNIAIP